MSESLPPTYFEDIYRQHDDPWQFETSPYEADKYAATVGALPKPRYRNGFEIGCSIGVLTTKLAERCDALLSIDVSAEALARAKARCRAVPQVRFARMSVPHEYPPDSFDLTVLSEVGYYLSPSDLALAQEEIVTHLTPGGHLLLVHWTPVVPDYPQTGDQVHDSFMMRVGHDLHHLGGHRAESYRLDLFERL